MAVHKVLGKYLFLPNIINTTDKVMSGTTCLERMNVLWTYAQRDKQV